MQQQRRRLEMGVQWDLDGQHLSHSRLGTFHN
jgi:hypothetical protein